jgi:hypothetical protein
MAATAALKKAQLEIEGEQPPIDCWFNPNEYTISKANDWNIKPVVGATLPKPQFGGGRAREPCSSTPLTQASATCATSPTGCSR